MENTAIVTENTEKLGQGKNVFVNYENITKISKFRGFFEDEIKSNKLKEINEYVTNRALDNYFKSNEFKSFINEAIGV